MKDPVLWRCLFNGSEELTVGKIFQLHCEGSLGVSLKDSLTLEFPEGIPPFSLVLLDVVKKNETSFDLNVTSYRAGKFKTPYIRISDGEVQIESTELEWTVNSVLQQDSKPIPPKGPFFLDLPFALVYIVAAIAALLLTSGGFFFWRHRKKVALNSDLEKYHSHLSPIRQFESSVRTLRNSLVWRKDLNTQEKTEILDALDNIIRIYFLRTLRVRTHGLSRRGMTSIILKSGKVKDPKSWIGYYKELESSKAKVTQLDSQALLQIVETASGLVIKFENQEKKN